MLVGFFLFFMAWQPSPAYGATAQAKITCQDPDGNQKTFTTGWDNENDYFLDKGNIAQFFCEGGFAGTFTSFVGVVFADGSELDPALLYHPGYVAPAPDPVAPDNSVSEETTETLDRTEDVERPEEPTEIEQIPSPSPEPVPSEPLAPLEPSPEPEPTPESPKKPVEAPKPTESSSPTPKPVEPSTPVIEPQIPTEPTSEPESEDTVIALEAIGKLLDNLRLIGSDMTPEVREQAQQVIVASVIVTQIALAGRKP